MKKFYKIAGIIAGVAFAVGLVFMMIGVAAGANGAIMLTTKGFKLMDNTERWEYSNEDEQPFTSIDIQVNSAEIYIIESETDKYTVDFDLAGSEDDYIFSNEDGSLLIKDKDSSKKYVINIFGGIVDTTTDAIYICVPKGVQLEKINVDSNVGDIDIALSEGAKKLNVSADVGEIRIVDGEYEVVELLADVGDIETKDIEVTEKIKASTDLGEIKLQGKFSCNMDVSTDVGNINIKTSLSEKHYRYEVSADAGKVEVFGTKSSGADIDMGGNSDAEFSIKADASLGNVKIKSVSED